MSNDNSWLCMQDARKFMDDTVKGDTGIFKENVTLYTLAVLMLICAQAIVYAIRESK